MKELYEPLIERDLGSFERVARAFARLHSPEDLWIAVARFAVLAYAPSQHAKRAVLAARAAWDLRAALAERFVDMTIACARYAAESRPPWSEPPILEPPPGEDLDLREAVRAGDRLAAERWLSAHSDDAAAHLRSVVRGDARLLLDAAVALEVPLGAKGRYALLRMAIHELFVPTDDPSEPLPQLVHRAISDRGAVDAVRSVLVAHVRDGGARSADSGSLQPYELGRDYAQTLLAHTIEVPRRAELLAAVHHNLEHGESFADWSFA